LGGALLATFALSGHAAAQPAPFLPVLADWLHLLGTSLWIGGLFQFGLLLPVVSRLESTQRIAVLAMLIARFSPLALFSVLVLAVTGTYAALLHMSSWTELWTTSYGQTLLVKLVVFGGLLGLGAYNMLVVRPRFVAWTTRAAESVVTNRWQRRFARALRGEIVLALLVIGVASVRTSLAPSTAQSSAPLSSHAEHDASAAPAPTYTPIPSEPFDQTRSAGDLQVRLEITPASISQNQLKATVTDASGAPVAVQLVRLQLTMIDMDMGETQLELPSIGAGTYGTTASPLSMVGEWNVAVLVRRADADDVRAVFTVPVGET
jgi:copper transport protein